MSFESQDVEPEIQRNHVCRGLTTSYKWIFNLATGGAPMSALFKGQLYTAMLLGTVVYELFRITDFLLAKGCIPF